MIIQFLGGANEVGASSTLLIMEGQHILVDAGIRMGIEQHSSLPDLDDVRRIDAVLLTHSHSDHTGALPILVRDYLNANTKVYCTSPTRAITEELLNDSAGHKERDNEGNSPSGFNVCDVNNAMRHITEVRCGNAVPICGGTLTATWFPAGHVLGAAMIYIEGKEQRILMTGDVSAGNQLTLPDLAVPMGLEPDLMVMESTYGNHCHVVRTREENRLVQDVFKTIIEGGKVLIPAFAVGRSQETILILKRAMERRVIPEFPVYVDGMVRKINDIYTRFPGELSLDLRREAERGEDPFCSKFIRKVASCDERDRILKGESSCIVASSGMLNGGISNHYAKCLAGDRKNLIAITGYQANGTPGRALLDVTDPDGPTNREWKQRDGSSLRVRCRVKSYSLSAHADRDELTGLVGKVQPRKVFLVHGDRRAREKLKSAILEESPGVQVELPLNGDSFCEEATRLSGAA
ncbi:MAG: MBL fold metallo-hydrolase [Gemmatimonadota bacterium]|nr:MBL fold metallo-hydrolase [Gemmatimonadota bacterium]